jgi:hypothetical protein
MNGILAGNNRHFVSVLSTFHQLMLGWIQCRREGRKKVQISGARRSGTGPHYVVYDFFLLISLGFNQGVIWLVEGTCGQRPSCIRRPLLCFLTFPFVDAPLMGLELALGGPVNKSARLIRQGMQYVCTYYLINFNVILLGDMEAFV